MRILFIVPYSSEGPSNRFRIEQYLPFLKNEGIEYSIRPFFGSRPYKILYKNGQFIKKTIFLIICTFFRIRDLINSCNYDIVVLHREAYPFGSIFERLFRIFAKKIIYDFDDAIFLPSVSESNRLVEAFKDYSKTKNIIKISNAVIAGNVYLSEYAQRFNKNVFIVPTPIDTKKYFPFGLKSKNSEIIIGWIGSVTNIKYLDMLVNVFSGILNKYHNVYFVIVGGEWHQIKSSRIICRQWALENEVADLQSFDIGIMPLKDEEWSKGKCAFKLIEYMSVGIPAVASAVGMNKEVISDGINGFLAQNEKEWIEKLSILIEKPDLRKQMGLTGRKTVEEKYSVTVNAPKLLEIIKRNAGLCVGSVE